VDAVLGIDHQLNRKQFVSDVDDDVTKLFRRREKIEYKETQRHENNTKKIMTECGGREGNLKSTRPGKTRCGRGKVPDG
jgi:hypothetical protein